MGLWWLIWYRLDKFWSHLEMNIQQHLWISYPSLGNWGGNACPLEVAPLPGLGSRAEWKGEKWTELSQSRLPDCRCNVTRCLQLLSPAFPTGEVWATAAPTSFEWASWGVFCHNNKKRQRPHLCHFCVHDSAVLHVSRYCTTSLEIFHFAKIKYCSNLDSVQQKAM